MAAEHDGFEAGADTVIQGMYKKFPHLKHVCVGGGSDIGSAAGSYSFIAESVPWSAAGSYSIIDSCDESVVDGLSLIHI